MQNNQFLDTFWLVVAKNRSQLYPPTFQNTPPLAAGMNEVNIILSAGSNTPPKGERIYFGRLFD
ncbi:MAG: hypothetical protein AB1465_02965 [Patescibacteria group bacterium]